MTTEAGQQATNDGAALQTGSYRRAAFSGGGLALGGFATTQLLNFATYAILGRLVSPDTFGVFAAGSIVIMVGALFADSGMLAALITRRERLETAANTALLSVIVSGCLLSCVSYLAAPAIAHLFQDHRVEHVCEALSGVLFIRAVGIVPDAMLQRRLSFLRRMIVEPFGVIAFGVTAIVLARSGDGISALIWATYALTVTQTVTAWGFSRWRPHPRRASWSMWRELAGFARGVVLSEAIRRVAMQVDVVAVGRLAGPPALGQYRYAWRLALQPQNAWVAVGAYVLLPIFARISGDRKRLLAAFARANSVMAMAIFPASLLLVALGVPAALLLFGPQWREAGYAVMLLAGFPIGQAVVSVVSELFKATHDPGELPRIHGFSLAASLIWMVLLSSAGMLGIAAAMSCAACSTALFSLVRVRAVTSLELRTMLTPLGPPAIAASAMAATTWAMNHFVVRAEDLNVAVGCLALALEGALAIGFYAGVLVLISARHRELATSALRLARRRLLPNRASPSSVGA